LNNYNSVPIQQKGSQRIILEKKVHTCHKCHGEGIVKNGIDGYCNPQYHCGTCGA